MTSPDFRTTPSQIKPSLIVTGVFGPESTFSLRYSLHRTICTTRSVSRENIDSESKCATQEVQGALHV